MYKLQLCKLSLLSVSVVFNVVERTRKGLTNRHDLLFKIMYITYLKYLFDFPVRTDSYKTIGKTV